MRARRDAPAEENLEFVGMQVAAAFVVVVVIVVVHEI